MISVVEFYTENLNKSIPVVLTGCIDDWPAFQHPISPSKCNSSTCHSWNDLNYIKRGNYILFEFCT
jgi:hypothetical protein